jgi:hypothetical protein
MFQKLTVTGREGSLLIGGLSTAAVLGKWTITKQGGGWQLTAAVQRIDRFLVRLPDLGFTAPKAGGFWWWPVLTLVIDDRTQSVRATLRSPEK